MSVPYYYSVVKVAPHPIRDETFNLGVILISESGDYSDFRFTTHVRQKLRALAPDAHFATIQRFVEDFKSRFPRVGAIEPLYQIDRLPVSVEVLKEFAARYSTQIKLTAPRPVIAEDPNRILRKLFEEFVAPIRLARKPLVDRPTIRRWILHTLRNLSVPKAAIVDHPSIPVRHGTNTLDIGVRRNGARNGVVAVALEPISFALSSADEIVRQRDHVAWVAYDSVPAAGARLAIGAVVTQPIDSNRRLFDESTSIFRDVGVVMVQFEQTQPLRDILVRAGVGQQQDRGNGIMR
jgi:hypothetical protein